MILNCISCLYYEYGLCKRFPPVPLVTTRSGTNEHGGTVTVERIETRYPEVAEDDGCGEWKSTED